MIVTIKDMMNNLNKRNINLKANHNMVHRFHIPRPQWLLQDKRFKKNFETLGSLTSNAPNACKKAMIHSNVPMLFAAGARVKVMCNGSATT
jgi:hypothetical protein